MWDLGRLVVSARTAGGQTGSQATCLVIPLLCRFEKGRSVPGSPPPIGQPVLALTMTAEAGLVPWADTGMMQTSRWWLPREW